MYEQMMMAVKPCACGATPYARTSGTEDDMWYWVSCPACGNCTADHDEAYRAINVWNLFTRRR